MTVRTREATWCGELSDDREMSSSGVKVRPRMAALTQRPQAGTHWGKPNAWGSAQALVTALRGRNCLDTGRRWSLLLH